MKKFSFLIALCFVIGFFTPCSKADASTVPQSVIDSAITLNYGVDNIIIWQYHAEPNYYYTAVELDETHTYGTNYYHDLDQYYSNPWYLADNEGLYCLVSPSWWWLRVYKYDISTGMWSMVQDDVPSRYGNLCNSTGFESVTDLYKEIDRVVVYASQDIPIRGGCLDGQTFFTVPSVPMFPMTELAAIVEESKPQTNLIHQVISLLPLSLSLVVSFLGLRKLLSLLRTILFQA